MSCQALHSAIDFVMEYPEISKEWHETSNYICQLSVKDEKELYELGIRAEKKGLKIMRFYEPDLDNQMTAITIEPTEAARKFTSSIPLLFKNLKN